VRSRARQKQTPNKTPNWLRDCFSQPTPLDEVVRLVPESMIEHGDEIPAEPSDEVQVTVDPRVAINV
jgi:hypothetical protein